MTYASSTFRRSLLNVNALSDSCYMEVSDLEPIGYVIIDLGNECDAVVEDVDCLLGL